MIDALIDEALDLQERVLRMAVTKVPDFARQLNAVLNMKTKASDSFHKLLES